MRKAPERGRGGFLVRTSKAGGLRTRNSGRLKFTGPLPHAPCCSRCTCAALPVTCQLTLQCGVCHARYGMSEHCQLISTEAAAKPYYAGIDIGGTNIKIGVVDDRGRTLGRTSTPTSVQLGPDAAIARIQGILSGITA